MFALVVLGKRTPEGVQKEKMPYLVAVTKHSYLTRMIAQEADKHDIITQTIEGRVSAFGPLGHEEGFIIRESKADGFQFMSQRQAESTRDKVEGEFIEYTLHGEWFPNHILNDEMGMLDHMHYPRPNFDDVEEA